MSEQDNTSDDIILGVSYSALEKDSAKIKMLEKEILNMFFKIDRLERELAEANEENDKLKVEIKELKEYKAMYEGLCK
jgi:phage shock protein A